VVRRALGAALALLALAACGPPKPKHPVVRAGGEQVRIPLASLADAPVHFFTFPAGRVNVDFLVRRDDDGALHASFDACYTCYRFGKGYRVEGPDLVCNECGTKFRIGDREWKRVGACDPISLPAAVEGDDLVVTVADLRRGERLFRKR